MESFVHLAIIWTSTLIAIWISGKLRLTPVLMYLFMGALLANVGVLPDHPDEFIRHFAELGIIVIMFALGFEENVSHFVQSLKRTWGIAFFGALAPFLTAYTAATIYWGEHNIALMCGLAMTATAVSLTMVSLRCEGLSRSKAATGIMTSAVLDDIASLALVAILVPIATGQASTSAGDVLWIASKAILFFVVVIAIGLVLFPHDIKNGWLSRIPLIRSYGIRHLLELSGGTQGTLVILLVALVVGLTAYAFGFHPAVGAYMAGLVLKEDYFLTRPEIESDQYDKTRQIIDDVAFSWIGPVFFVTLGTHLVFEREIFLSIFDEGLILFVALVVAQVVSAGLAARYTGRFQWRESVLIGLGMLGRAELAFVVIDIAYVQHQLLSKEAFYTLMLTTFLLNVTVPLSIRWWKPYYTGEKALPKALKD